MGKLGILPIASIDLSFLCYYDLFLNIPAQHTWTNEQAAKTDFFPVHRALKFVILISVIFI